MSIDRAAVGKEMEGGPLRLDVYGREGKIGTVRANGPYEAVALALEQYEVPPDEKTFRVVNADVPVYFAETIRHERRNIEQ